MCQSRVEELHRRALEAAMRMKAEKKKLIRELVEASPNSIMYMGYIPVHLKGKFER